MRNLHPGWKARGASDPFSAVYGHGLPESPVEWVNIEFWVRQHIDYVNTGVDLKYMQVLNNTRERSWFQGRKIW